MRIIITLLSITLLFITSSCKLEYNCECVTIERNTTTGEQTETEINTTVTSKISRKDASRKCDEMSIDGATSDSTTLTTICEIGRRVD